VGVSARGYGQRPMAGQRGRGLMSPIREVVPMERPIVRIDSAGRPGPPLDVVRSNQTANVCSGSVMGVVVKPGRRR
jgi:hypothetical protein